MIEENVSLKTYSHYKIGGSANYFCRAATVADVAEALEFAHKKKLPVFVLGGGTNLLISDEGFAGLVLKPELLSLQFESEEIITGCGVGIESLLGFAISKSLAGLEWAGGLPGTIGGAVRGNAGAFGGEIKDSVVSVLSIIPGKKPLQRERTAQECKFGYRTSVFKTDAKEEVIVQIRLRLHAGESDAIKAIAEEKINHRKTRHPLEYPNIGSIFKNVPWASVPLSLHEKFASHIKADPFPVIPTAFILSSLNLQGVAQGGAMISKKHPNFIVNTGNAKASDVAALIALVKAKVLTAYAIALEEEVVRVGHFA